MKRLLALIGAGMILAACSFAALPPTPSPTAPPPPTATPEPLAATVGGEAILLSDFEEEAARFESAQASLGTDLASLGDYRSRVLQAMIDRMLLAQGAVEAGHTFDGAAVDAEVDAVAQARGGNEAMAAWMVDNRYTLDSLKRALREDKLTAMMIEDITQNLGESAEQVRAAHLLVATRAEAEDLLAQLQAGADFAELARQFSLDASTRPAGGDLGWSPRGFLLVPQVDETAWSLAPGETSGVVESPLGYHIVRLLERGDHVLSPAGRHFVRDQAVLEWLAARRSTTPLEIYAAP